MSDFNILKQYAHNQDDLDCLDLLSQGLSQREVAEALDTSKKAVESRLGRIRARSETTVWDEEGNAKEIDPSKHVVKGTSTLYDEDGKQKLQWVKLSRSHEEIMETMKDIVEGMKDEIPKASPVKSEQKTYNSDLLNLHVITDYHFGMMADVDETKDSNWDIKIAEKVFLAWMKQSIEQSPNSHTGILCNLGDCLHSDSLLPVTPTSFNVLDQDSRYYKIVRTVIRCMRSVIEMMLEKYQHVHVIHAEGNHDLSGSVWLREMFNVMYEDEPRITVDTNPDVFYAYEHGDVSLFIHHGHRKRIKDIDAVFASKYRDMFGRTKFSYGHMGHLHHIDVKESNLMVVEQHRTMAPKDSHSSTHGYASNRSAAVITYHKAYGEVSRLTLTPEMIEIV